MKPWFEYESVAGPVQVVRMSEAEHPALVLNEGVSYPSRLLIVIHEGLPYQRACRAAHHEIMHMDVGNPGESGTLCLSLHCTMDEVADREENAIAHIAPRNADTLFRNGFLKYPRFPR